MKFKSVFLSLFMLVFFDSMAFQEQSVVKDELIISFAQTANINSSKNATGKRTITTSNSSLDKLLKNSNISKIELAYPRVSELKPSKYKDQLLRTYKVKYNNNKLNELGNNLKKFKNEIEFVDIISVESLFHTPNDYHPLWNYWVNYDYSLNLIKAEQAWDITKGSSNVKIAVIDTDFDLTHEELINQVVYDDNGGCNYSSYSTCSHGTKVAGNVAGQTNNGKGKSAIGYNCKLMVYRGLSYSNITNAALDGADVINCSWGSFSYSSFNQTLINAAENEGAIIVAAAGNQPTVGVNITDYMYPASYDNVISVMAVDSDKKYGCINCSSTPIAASRTFIQNDKIDVASPGISVPVIIPSSSWNTDNGYTPAYENYPLFGDNGTSFSSPIVAGLIGLMLTVNPCLTTNEIEYILKQTGEDVYSLPVNSYFLQTYGTEVPLIDAYEAVKAARDFPQIVIDNTTTSGSSTLCTTNQTYTINNPAGTTVSWSVSPTNLFAVDMGIGSSFTTRATNSLIRGAGVITATVSGNCGSYTDTKDVWVGRSSPPIILFPYTVMGQNSSFTIEATAMNAETYNWQIAGGQLINGQGSPFVFVRTNSSCPVDFSIRVSASNSCGTSPVSSKTIPFNCNGFPIPVQIIITPNPATNEVTVNLTGLFANQATGEAEVYLYNSTNEVVYKTLTQESSLVIPTNNLVDGLYFLNAVYLDKTFQRKIIIKH